MNDPAHLGDAEHVAYMSGMQWRFPNHHDKLTSLLQYDVGRAGEQRCRHAASHLGERSHRAWGDQHTHRLEGAAGNRSADVPDRVGYISQGMELLPAEIRFVVACHLPGLGHHKMAFDAKFPKHFQGADAVDDACGSSDTNSPPPDYNFAFTPVVHDHDSWYDMKNRGYSRPLEGFKPIHMPKNTGTGAILSALSVALAFGLIWYMWWLVIVSFVAILAVAIGHTFNYKRDFYIAAEDVEKQENARPAS